MKLKAKFLMTLSGLLMLSGYVNAELVDSSSIYIVTENKKIPITLKPVNSLSQTQTAVQSPAQIQNLSQNRINVPLKAPSGNYTFPQEINNGYWAMTTTMDGVASTVAFSKDYIHIHQFQCHSDGSYDKLKTYSYGLEPSQSGMGLKRQDGSHYSELRLIEFKPLQSLYMHQNFLANYELRQAMPNGIDLHYVYTPNLVANCPATN